MISVIMLTYNREKFVDKMIGDIANQTYQEYEFIIIDNGSDDSTPQKLRNYSIRDSRIRVVTIPKGSIGYARNIGVHISKGEYIAFVDDDDRVEKDYLEFLYKIMLEDGADIAICGVSEGDGETRSQESILNDKRYLSGEGAVELLIDRKYIRAGMPGKLYKKSILDKYPFVENYENEDVHTQYKYLLAADKVVFYGLDKYYAIRHEGNVSRFTSSANMWTKRIMSDYLTAYHNRTQFIKENAPNIYEKTLYSEWSYMISMVEKISRYNLQDCMKIKARLIKELQENEDYFYSMKWIKPFELDWMKQYVDI